MMSIFTNCFPDTKSKLDMWHLESNHPLSNVLKWKSLRQLIKTSYLGLAAGPVLVVLWEQT